MAEIFDCSSDNIGVHLKNIYAEHELEEEATTEEFSVVQQEGSRIVNRQVKHYNLDAIIVVGYRVNNNRATALRKRATKVLREIVINGKHCRTLFHDRRSDYLNKPVADDCLRHAF